LIVAKATHAVSAPVEHITRSILILRGRRVILDRDLAAIYGVSTGRFNEAVKLDARPDPQGDGRRGARSYDSLDIRSDELRKNPGADRTGKGVGSLRRHLHGTHAQ
jgi:hypothetical protein